MIYRSKLTGGYLKLIKKRESGINTFVETDEKGVAIKIKRDWSSSKQKQFRFVRGFDSLEEVKK